ncbi:MAG: DUF2330 domain-containing protein, partial [Gammaproteobacteria bacterium]|nr:DUF2330 domain-containing protein [Gammaproteobacteria bacterium]
MRKTQDKIPPSPPFAKGGTEGWCALASPFAKGGLRGIFFFLLLGVSSQAAAFCGFYVAKADTGLFNESSQVVYVRDENRNVVTMASDFKGDVKDFALVVPVPTVLKREQINVANHATLEHLDAY